MRASTTDVGLTTSRYKLYTALHQNSGRAPRGVKHVFVQSEELEEQGDAEPYIARLSALQLLQAGFGLGAVCTGKTYKGTAPVPVLAEGADEAALSKAGPGVTGGSKPAWSSCKPLTGEEASADEWGQAVGWTSGKTAWLLYARDEKAARTLVTALYEAAH